MAIRKRNIPFESKAKYFSQGGLVLKASRIDPDAEKSILGQRDYNVALSFRSVSLILDCSNRVFRVLFT